MNHIYRIVYNKQTGTFQAVAETAKTTTKSSRSAKVGNIGKSMLGLALSPLTLAVGFLTGQNAHASPTDGVVTAGQAVINQTGTVTNINQSSQNAAINWQSFNVGKNETVNFNQPNAQSVTLNRVIGNERSIIDGAMNANGKVFISNANGMLIGKDAKINVGSLVATTANISDDDLMNGRYQFTGEGAGNIENLGQISVPKGGVVALVAPIVKNGGTITAHEGNVLLASAESFSITLPDNANFAYTLDKGTLQGLVDNSGAILADAGRVVLTAKGVDTVKKSLIKHSGNIEANTVQNKNGVIELLGDLDNSALTVSGSLKAEAKASGDGGFIETSASQVKIEDSAEVSTLAENGKTGTWLIDPNDIIIASGAGKKPDSVAYTQNEITATGKTIANSLAKTGVIIESTKGKSAGRGDVIIDDEISWNANPLKLVAQNDIHINKTLNGTGTASLALEYGQGSKDGKYKATVDGKETTLDNDYYLDKNTPLKDRTVKVNLPEGKNFSTKKGSKGEVHEFDVIHKMPEIVKNANGDWESQFTERNIALGKDIDVAYTKDYDGFAGWQLAKDSNNEWGRVAGLGHTVSNLSLHSKKHKQPTGLFQKNQQGNIRDIGVLNVHIRSDGENSHTGGLLGYGTGSQISNSYATGSVSSSGYNAFTGGLVGSGSQISNSYATGSVSSSGSSAQAGGLVGYGSGSQISNSYATGSVSSSGHNAFTGGLVGYGYGSGYQISNSYATGSVSSSGDKAATGGLVGSGSQISNSYASNPHLSATGEASFIGGLVGVLNYSGVNHKNSFFNQDKHPNLPAIGKIEGDNSKITNVTGKTDSELKDRTTFEGWDFDNVWYMNDGEMPKLRAFATNNQPTPTQPANPTITVPAQPTQPSNPAVPNTPTVPVTPIQPEQDNSIETAKPKFPNWKDFPCKLPKDCIDKGLNKIGEGWNNLKEEHNRKIQALIAEDNREELFYYTNPKINKDDFENYLDEMRRASQNPEYIVDEYLADFPQDLKVSVSSDLTIREYLSKVIQYHNLRNIQGKYNDELMRFADNYIINTPRDNMVMVHTDKMQEFQERANNLPKSQGMSIGEALMDSVYMFSDVGKFAVNGAQLVGNFIPGATELQAALGTSIETSKILANSPKILAITYNFHGLASQMATGQGFDKDKFIDISSNFLEVMEEGDNALFKTGQSLNSIRKIKETQDKLIEINKVSSSIRLMPDDVVPDDFKKSILDLLKVQEQVLMTDMFENMIGVVSFIPGVNIGKDLIATLNAGAQGFANTETRRIERFYQDNINKMNHANKNYQEVIHYRTNAIETMIK